MYAIGRRFGPLILTGFSMLALAVPPAAARSPGMRGNMPPNGHNNCLACHAHRSTMSLPMNLTQQSFLLPTAMGRLSVPTRTASQLILGEINSANLGTRSRPFPLLVPIMPTNPAPVRMTLPACCMQGASPVRMRPVR
jgi:hypothetical protein